MSTQPAAGNGKQAERGRRSRTYRELVSGLAGASDLIRRPSAAGIFDCLSRAHLNERNAAGSRLARVALQGENPGAMVPEELSDKAIMQYLANAAELYGDAAAAYVLMADLVRGYKCYRKAAAQYRKAAQWAASRCPALMEKARQYQDKAAAVRQELARRSLRRRRLSFGLLGRLR